MLVFRNSPSTSVNSKMKFTLALLGAVCLIALVSAKPADEEYEYDEEEPPPPAPTPKQPARINPVLNRRNPLSRAPAAKTTTTTTTPAPSSQEEELEENGEGENLEGSSTTAAPKKLIGAVRPFRSNDDLLAALKRRREQAASDKSHVSKNVEQQGSAPAPSTAPAEFKPSRASSSGRRRFSKPEKEVTSSESDAPSPAPVRSGRRFSARN